MEPALVKFTVGCSSVEGVKPNRETRGNMLPLQYAHPNASNGPDKRI